MKKLRSINLLSACLVLLALGINSSYGQNVWSANCVPPQTSSVQGGSPQYLGSFHATYPNGGNVYDLTQPVHAIFSACNPPPATPGLCESHSFGSHVKAKLRTNGGAIMDIDAPAAVTVNMCKIGGADAQTGTYQTEMLQLDIQGGNLPAGVMIRESPTLQSTGQTQISHSGANYQIDSFFDIFTELSTDGGASWTPSSAGPGHMTLTASGSGIPTLNQWGLIIFTMLILATAVFFLRRRQLA